MEFTVVFLSISLIISIIFNAYLFLRFSKKKRVLSMDAQALLHDLSDGRTILKIDVLDKAALFLRSPRDME